MNALNLCKLKKKPDKAYLKSYLNFVVLIERLRYPLVRKIGELSEKFVRKIIVAEINSTV